MLEVTKSKKTIAIVIFNLGGPDKLDSVKPFLFNLFNDKYIITLPLILRFFVAKIISITRENLSKTIYSYIGGKSPILPETIIQQKSLERELAKHTDSDFKIFTCMRHWHPKIEEVVRDIKNYNPSEVVVMPLYPQFSTTTTGSFIEKFTKDLRKNFTKALKIKTICCYSLNDSFIEAMVNLIEENLIDINNLSNYRILFSAHGLPERVIKSGDPYQWQIEKTTLKIVNKLNLNPKFKNLDYKVTYQSKVGPLKWLEPNTENEIKIAGKLNINLVIVPIAFVSENVETLVELDIEYKKIADQYKIVYTRIPTLRSNDLFIKALSKIISNFIKKDFSYLSSSEFKRICPATYNKCPCLLIN